MKQDSPKKESSDDGGEAATQQIVDAVIAEMVLRLQLTTYGEPSPKKRGRRLAVRIPATPVTSNKGSPVTPGAPVKSHSDDTLI
jgi:hypothetical protein